MPCPILIATIMRPEGDTGVQTHFRTFAAWLAKAGQPARVITPYDAPKWKVYPTFALRRLIDPLSGTASVWWYRHWHEVFLFHALRTALADGAPCVVYAQCPLSADAAMLARVSPAQRVVMVTHFNLSQADEWAGKGAISKNGRLFNSIRHFEAAVLPHLDGLVFVSEFMRSELAGRIPKLAAVPYRVIPNFLPDPGTQTAHDTPEADLICIGTLEPRKNQRYALEILAAAQRLGRPLHLTLVGDGPDRPELEAHARRLGVMTDVCFAGYVRSAASLLPKHRACLHVANIENLPLTLVEALSRGLPVFAPAVGGIPEVFDDGVHGRVIPLDDVESAARLIIEWIDAFATLARAGAAARARFLERFEADAVAASLTNFLCGQE